MSQRRKRIYLAEISTEIDCGGKCKKQASLEIHSNTGKVNMKSQNVHFWVLTLNYFQISVRKLECLTLFPKYSSKRVDFKDNES